MRLSDTIESFIKRCCLRDETEGGAKRNELAEYFAAHFADQFMCWPHALPPTTGMSLRAGAAEADTSALCVWSVHGPALAVSDT